MVAAKLKTVQLLIVLIYLRMVNELLRQNAATHTYVYDENQSRKSEKSPIGIETVAVLKGPTCFFKPANTYLAH